MSDNIRSALSFIPAHDRKTWIEVGMALQHELGDAGFDMWDEWSATDQKYNPRDVRVQWKGFKPGRGITIGTLFALAKQNGWAGEPRIEPRIERERKPEDDVRRHAQAAARALAMITAASMDEHPYLAQKGFPKERGLVWESLLLIPMRDVRSYAVTSVQTIAADGTKKFLAGGRAKGAVFKIGSGETYLCEGYATGLSIRAALASLYRAACVVVCFSAANLAFVAKSRRGLVIADNDESGTGEKYARETGLAWWMPPQIGFDANDYHLNEGVRALAGALNGLRRAGQGSGAVARQYVSSDSGLSVRSCTVGESRESV